MKVGSYNLEKTNDGNGIYINSVLVDDKLSCPNYWKGWDKWVEILYISDFYDFFKRNEIIQESRYEK